MGDKTPKKFFSSLGLQLTTDEVVGELLKFMYEAPERRYRVTIGSDSEKRSDNTADFVTAIVIHRIGNGGRYFWRRLVPGKKFHTLRDRITEEVLMSIDIAQEFLTAAHAAKLPEFDFEIHLDVGETGATKTIMAELVGMIRAHNFEARTKPDSYAASKVADRHV